MNARGPVGFYFFGILFGISFQASEAAADVLMLTCKGTNRGAPYYRHLNIDIVGNTVSITDNGKASEPYTASISNTSIKWTQPMLLDQGGGKLTRVGRVDNVLDRLAGTWKWASFYDEPGWSDHGVWTIGMPCAKAAQAF